MGHDGGCAGGVWLGAATAASAMIRDAETPMTPPLEASPPVYVPRNPSTTVLYRVVADHLATLLASLNAAPDVRGLPVYVAREFMTIYSVRPRAWLSAAGL